MSDAIKIIIISGGQTGVDIAALRAAKSCGLQTGGWMPKGWLTEDGPRPEYAGLYNMAECPDVGYPARTRRNVQAADFTIWYGPEGSRGWKATKAANGSVSRPFYRVTDGCMPGYEFFESRIPRGQTTFTINCAGNREGNRPGISQQAEAFFLTYFQDIVVFCNRVFAEFSERQNDIGEAAEQRVRELLAEWQADGDKMWIEEKKTDA